MKREDQDDVSDKLKRMNVVLVMMSLSNYRHGKAILKDFHMLNFMRIETFFMNWSHSVVPSFKWQDMICKILEV